MTGFQGFLTYAIVAVTALAANAAAAETPPLQFKPVPPITPVFVGKPSPAYDWIEREHIRGMYCYAGEFKKKDLLDHIAAAGFNTVIVHMAGSAMSEKGWPEEVAEWSKVQTDRKLHVIVSWPFGSDERYSNAQFGLYDTGTSKRFTRTPCPQSRAYWEKVVGDRTVLAAKGGLTGMVVDMEMYGADQTGYDGPCYCDLCWKRFVGEHVDGGNASMVPAVERDKWIKEHHLAADYAQWQEAGVIDILQSIRKRVRAASPTFLLGNLHLIETLPGLARGFGTSDMPALIFGEREYKGRDEGFFNVSQLAERVANLRKNGYPAIFVTGFWPLHVTPPRLPDLVRTLAMPYAGYWIWSSAAFVPDVSGDYAHAKEYTDDDYWKAFRRVNTELDARRELK